MEFSSNSYKDAILAFFTKYIYKNDQQLNFQQTQRVLLSSRTYQQQPKTYKSSEKTIEQFDRSNKYSQNYIISSGKSKKRVSIFQKYKPAKRNSRKLQEDDLEQQGLIKKTQKSQEILEQISEVSSVQSYKSSQQIPQTQRKLKPKSIKKSVKINNIRNQGSLLKGKSKIQQRRMSHRRTLAALLKSTIKPGTKVIKQLSEKNIKSEQEKLQNQMIQQDQTFTAVDSLTQEQIDSDDLQRSQIQNQIQGELNLAVYYIQQNRLIDLQQFLYDFKARYTLISTKNQVKWRLFMAHCKQNRKQYERASIYYQQVLMIQRSNSNSLIIAKEDIYHKLGICYTQIHRWNDGIIAFMKAINGFKKSHNNIKYGQATNNLGRLYLLAGFISQAEECFITSFYVKKSIFGIRSIFLISTLYNISECNLMTRNYDQAQSIFGMIQQIIQKCCKNNQQQLARLCRKKAKMFLMKGSLFKSKMLLQQSQKFMKDMPLSLQYGQLLNCKGVLSQQMNNYEEARVMFQRASFLFNFYYSKENLSLKTLKRNMEMLDHLMNDNQNKTQSINYNMPKNKFNITLDQVIQNKTFN